MTLAEIKDRAPSETLRRIEESKIDYLWIGDFWDGPLSGMLILDGSECWFECFAESEEEGSPWYRRYAVVSLSPEQLKQEKEVHADFQQYVGRHWDCDASSEDRGVRPQEKHHLFYDKHLEYCRKRSFGDREVIAWFER
jgi:hypothetical protein